jgi:hypothetical protein
LWAIGLADEQAELKGVQNQSDLGGDSKVSRIWIGFLAGVRKLKVNQAQPESYLQLNAIMLFLLLSRLLI